MSKKEDNQQPSLRQQIKIYKSTLSGEALAKFNEVFKDKEETLSIKKAFVAAKEAAQAVLKEQNK